MKKTERAAGVLLHPSSFPGPHGIGELNAYGKEFIDFLSEANMKLWQILPLNPTSFGDSPYQSFSTFAGNPNLICLDTLASELGFTFLNEECFNPYLVDYGNVIEFKRKVFKTAFERFQKEKSKKEYTAFCRENLWLQSFALFSAIKEYFILKRKNENDGNAYVQFCKKMKDKLTQNQLDDYYYGGVWSTWPEDLIRQDPHAMAKMKDLLAERIEYHQFLQYEFFTQWHGLKSYANKQDIQVVGDLPIFVAYDSADTWTNQDLFQLDQDGFPTFVAGVPPDYFSKTGQLWGNPLYHWPLHTKTGYAWWHDRIEQTLSTVDIVRIDHFRGFESYWSVPFGDKTAENGQWIKAPGKDLFQALERKMGRLPIIAEDLGIITEDVKELRDHFQLPGMKVLQFAFESGPENDYLPHSFENSNCVVYTGTHDNDTTWGWYRKSPEAVKDYVRRYMNVSGEQVSWDFIRLAFSSSAKYAVAPLQDVLSLDSEARMNTPGIPSGNWQFRYVDGMLTAGLSARLSYESKLFNRS